MCNHADRFPFILLSLIQLLKNPFPIISLELEIKINAVGSTLRI